MLTQIARTYGLQMKFDEAHEILDEVEPQLSDEFYLAKIRYLLERGRTFRSSKQIEKSRPLFLEAYEIGLKHKEDDYTIDAAHMLGIIEPYKEAQDWNELAMKLAEKTKDEKARRWLGPLYNNTAWNYHDNKEYDKALKVFEKNVEWHTNRKSVEQLIIAKWSVARTLRSLNKIDKAIEMQNSIMKETKEKGLAEDGYVYEELGELYLLKENKEESKKCFALAYDLLSKDIWLAANEKERLERMKALSE
ncbi:MAG: hypothetical protein IPL53_00940 [Ignavibacteria bacterium]|nr:hypothetical protein [Ignavibacteria bacterium]